MHVAQQRSAQLDTSPTSAAPSRHCTVRQLAIGNSKGPNLGALPF